ncbi:MAG: hypothetical protein HC916_14655 [Coleofasciculaceae cyanobacterium SM2_1_6]|nr:hypothetical protein [Coleofasciculaceae cyanobacterium SM2_1_6]
MANLPKIKDMATWQQAELVMQPAFIRIVDHIRQNLESCAWQESYAEIHEPEPQYLLSLKQEDQLVQVDLWQLCYAVCFRDYVVNHLDQAVEIDLALIDADGGVAWEALDRKAKALVDNIFANLPASSQ